MGKQSLPDDCNGIKNGWSLPVNGKEPGEHPWLSLVRKYNMKSVAEVGVLTGSLAYRVVKACDLDIYYAIDPWKVYFEWCDDIPFDKVDEIRADEKSKHRFDQEHYDTMYKKVVDGALKKFPAIKIIRETSVIGSKQVPDNSLDGVYIDGVHDFPNGLNDIWCWLPKMKRTGIICGHDYMTRFTGLIRIIDFVFGNDFTIPVDKVGDDFGTNWYVKLTEERKQKYMNRINDKFTNPKELLNPVNKYMHFRPGFMEKLYDANPDNI